MSDVATRAGVSTGGLYRYFSDKENLFTTLIGDIHEEFFNASRPKNYDFAEDPYNALLEANYGYLSHYYKHRDLMRVFIEAATLNESFSQIWWRMRNRHVERFLAVLNKHFKVRMTPKECELAAQAMACMVEHCAYVWYAQERMNSYVPSLEEASKIVTDAWYHTFFS